VIAKQQTRPVLLPIAAQWLLKENKMDLFNILQKLQAIGQVTEAEEKCSECGHTPCECDDKEKVEEAKKPDADGDGVPDWADKKPGADDKEEKVDEGAMDKLKAFGKKALDTLGHGDDEAMIKDLQRKMGVPQTGKKPEAEPEKQVKESELDLLRKLAGLQEAKIDEDDVEEGNEFSGALQKAKAAGEEEFEVGGKKYKVNECGDMDQMAQMSPMSSVSDMATPVQVIQSPDAEMAASEEQPEMAQEQEPARYTLTISNGDSNLSMTTDVPDEIIHIMKLAGVNKGAEVTKQAAPEAGEKEVEEAWGNTPTATKEKEPHAYGDIRDWAMKGTGGGKAGSAANKPYGSGDNPLSEDAILGDYKLFKSSK
jgi:hypothetical protein